MTCFQVAASKYELRHLTPLKVFGFLHLTPSVTNLLVFWTENVMRLGTWNDKCNFLTKIPFTHSSLFSLNRRPSRCHHRLFKNPMLPQPSSIFSHVPRMLATLTQAKKLNPNINPAIVTTTNPIDRHHTYLHQLLHHWRHVSLWIQMSVLLFSHQMLCHLFLRKFYCLTRVAIESSTLV